MMKSSEVITGIATASAALFAAGCGEHASTENTLRHDESRNQLVPVLGTNAYGMVSIGITTTDNSENQRALVQFFASNGIACGLEGSVVYDVMVRQDQVEDARRFFRTNLQAVRWFIPATDLDSSN